MNTIFTTHIRASRTFFTTALVPMVLVATVVAVVLFNPDCSRAAKSQIVIEQVTAAGPSWPTFTNRDGTGLYHEILEKVFGLYSIPVRRIYATSEAACDLVRQSKADMMTCRGRPTPGLVFASHPMYEGTYYAFFRKENVPDWKGALSLRNRTVVWRTGYYTSENLTIDELKIVEVPDGTTAMEMVCNGTVDFYIDDLNLLKQSLEHSSCFVSINSFGIEPVGRRAYYPVFNETPRGKIIRELFDKGMETLYENGELSNIFNKWNHPFPHYSLQ